MKGNRVEPCKHLFIPAQAHLQYLVGCSRSGTRNDDKPVEISYPPIDFVCAQHAMDGAICMGELASHFRAVYQSPDGDEDNMAPAVLAFASTVFSLMRHKLEDEGYDHFPTIVMHGAAGAGKTSILNAALAAVGRGPKDSAVTGMMQPRSSNACTHACTQQHACTQHTCSRVRTHTCNSARMHLAIRMQHVAATVRARSHATACTHARRSSRHTHVHACTHATVHTFTQQCTHALSSTQATRSHATRSINSARIQHLIPHAMTQGVHWKHCSGRLSGSTIRCWALMTCTPTSTRREAATWCTSCSIPTATIVQSHEALPPCDARCYLRPIMSTQTSRTSRRSPGCSILS